MKKESIGKLKRKLKDRKSGRITDIDGEKIKPEYNTETRVIQQASDYKDKVFVLEEITNPWRKAVEKKGLKLFRFGYYIRGKKPKKKGQWVWGQYSPIITDRDLKKIIEKWRKKEYYKLK